MGKHILIITSYYPPEIGAASNRIFQLANGLNTINHRVSVVTPLPNYPTGKIFEAYRGRFSANTLEQGIKVYRLWVFASNSKNKLHRLFSMFSYSLSLIWFFITHPIPKTVIVQSPPLFVAFTCMLFLKKKSRKLILNVSDLWPLAGKELGFLKEGFSYSFLKKIELFNYKRADLILGQSEEILTHVNALFPKKETFLYRNYPDFTPPKVAFKSTEKEGKIQVVYAGLLGVAQGIYTLVQALDYSKIAFHLYGSGAEQEQIQDYIKKHPNLCISYHGQVPRAELHESLLKYDVVIIPLLNRIYGSVPSKIFEYARLGLPVIYMGGGEGEKIVAQNDLGWVVDAGNYAALNLLLKKLTPADCFSKRKTIQEFSLMHFDFEKQLHALSTCL